MLADLLLNVGPRVGSCDHGSIARRRWTAAEDEAPVTAVIEGAGGVAVAMTVA